MTQGALCLRPRALLARPLLAPPPALRRCVWRQMVFGPWHEEDVEEWEGGGDGDFDLPPNGSQLHAQAGISVRPKRKRHAKLDPVVGEKAPQTEEKKAKGAPTRREKPEIGVQTRAAPISFLLDAAAGGFGATDFLKVRYDYHVVLTQPHANREKK